MTELQISVLIKQKNLPIFGVYLGNTSVSSAKVEISTDFSFISLFIYFWKRKGDDRKFSGPSVLLVIQTRLLEYLARRVLKKNSLKLSPVGKALKKDCMGIYYTQETDLLVEKSPVLHILSLDKKKHSVFGGR